MSDDEIKTYQVVTNKCEKDDDRISLSIGAAYEIYAESEEEARKIVAEEKLGEIQSIELAIAG